MISSAPPVRFSATRVLASLGICTLLLGAAQRVLGVPDPALLQQFAAGGRPSVEAVMATSALLVWTTLGMACAWLMLASSRGLRDNVGRMGRLEMRSGTVVLVIGVCLLAIALVRHATPGPQLCCGSMEEASQTLGR